MAILIGLPTTLVAVMALLRPVTSALSIQLGVALGLSVLFPVVVVARLFPDRPKREADSMSWDVLAILWMVLATGFVAVAHPYTRAPLAAEAQLLSSAGFPQVARVVELAAAVRSMPPAFGSPRIEPPAAVSPPPASASAPPSEDDVEPAPTTSALVPAPPVEDRVVTSPTPTEPPKAIPRPEAPLPLDQILERIAPSIVTVFVTRPDGPASATGFFIDARGIVATTHEIVDGATGLGIKRHDGTWVRGGELLGFDEELDYALLRFDLDQPAPGPTIASTTDAFPPGTELVSVACPFGLGKTLWVARVIDTAGGSVVDVDQDVPPLRAGSPVVNFYGEIVGMITRSKRSGQGAVLGLDAVLRRLESEDHPPRPLGPLPRREMF